MIVVTNTKNFEKQIKNIIQYSDGFLSGVQKGKTEFLKAVGHAGITSMAQYVDAQARSNPEALHHIYEWNRTGSPSARLFDLDYTISNIGLSIFGNFKQSKTLKEGSMVPFSDKARIMEKSITVTIRPKNKVLAFTVDGQEVFTSGDVTVSNPGGDYVEGSFEKTMDEFMMFYFKQSFLRASGIYDYIGNPTVFKKDIKQGARLGKSKGIQTGFKWIANVKTGVEK
jgi:hypothetical protein